MDPALIGAVLVALTFAMTNGFHDAANAIATLVATRAARPLPAIAMASVANLLGPFLLGAAVADAVAKIVIVACSLALTIGTALGGLRRQMAITVQGLAAFEAWAGGDASAATRVRSYEHDADEAKAEVRASVHDAFITPISPEDTFILSGNPDKILNWSKDTVREAEVMDMTPDASMAGMAERLHEGVCHPSRAFGAIDIHGGADHSRTATAAADEATKSARKMEKICRHAMSGLLRLEDQEVLRRDDVREIIGRRELCRRMSRIAEAVVDVADRVRYASVKEM